MFDERTRRALDCVCSWWTTTAFISVKTFCSFLKKICCTAQVLWENFKNNLVKNKKKVKKSGDGKSSNSSSSSSSELSKKKNKKERSECLRKSLTKILRRWKNNIRVALQNRDYKLKQVEEERMDKERNRWQTYNAMHLTGLS